RLGRVALRSDGRQLVETCATQQRVRMVVVRERNAQVVVGGEGFFDQRGQQRIVEAAPEFVVGGRRGDGRRRVRAHERVGCLRGGPDEIRPHRAGRQQRGGQGRHEGFQERGVHCRSSWNQAWAVAGCEGIASRATSLRSAT